MISDRVDSLLDVRRMNGFKTAFSKIIKPNHVVLDCGSGVGLLAASAGASKVYILESSYELFKHTLKLVSRSAYDQVEVLYGDCFETPVDIAIVDVETALYPSKLCVSSPVLVPRRVQAFYQLVQYDFFFGGVEFKSILCSRNLDRRCQFLSALAPMGWVDLSNYEPSVVHGREVAATQQGVVNALRFVTERELVDGVWATYGHEVIVPVKPVTVAAGMKLSVNIEYNAVCGLESMQAFVNQ